MPNYRGRTTGPSVRKRTPTLEMRLKRASLYLSLWKLLDRRRVGFEWLEIAPSEEHELLSEINRYQSSGLLIWADDRRAVTRDIENTLRLAQQPPAEVANQPEFEKVLIYIRSRAFHAIAQLEMPEERPSKQLPRGLLPSRALATIVGNSRLSRAEVTKRVWDYIKANDLQDSENQRMINADQKLRAVFGGKKQVSMFELTRFVNKNLK